MRHSQKFNTQNSRLCQTGVVLKNLVLEGGGEEEKRRAKKQVNNAETGKQSFP